MLCGTNDVDNILNIKKNNHSNVNIDASNFDQNKFGCTIHDIESLVDFIHNWTINAQINILNILPRASIHRNNVINNMNKFLMNMCFQKAFLNYINTECKLCLFSSSDGFRKMLYFKTMGTDNVHLNKFGIIRFGKHLKYLLHLDSPRRQL